MAEGPADTPASGDADSGVLAGLPATRPNRMGRHARDGAKPKATVAKAAAKPKATAPKAKAKTAAKPKAKAAAKPKAKAVPKAKAEPQTKPVAIEAKPTPIANGRKPRPVRAGHPGLDGAAEPRRDRAAEPDGGTGLVDSVTGAAAAGVRLGGRLLKGVAGRLPKP